MSWGEIKKAVNSDVREPLNHLLWISNINSFGSGGYALKNSTITNDLMLNSLSLFSDSVARQLVYENVSDKQIDDYLPNAKYFSDQMNRFLDYSTEFEGDNIDDFVSNYIGGLPGRFHEGYVRYAASKLSSGVGVGSWINRVFRLENPTLETLETFDDIKNNEEIIGMLLSHETILFMLSSIEPILTDLLSIPTTFGLIKAEFDNNIEIRSNLFCNKTYMKQLLSSASRYQEYFSMSFNGDGTAPVVTYTNNYIEIVRVGASSSNRTLFGFALPIKRRPHAPNYVIDIQFPALTVAGAEVGFATQTIEQFSNALDEFTEYSRIKRSIDEEPFFDGEFSIDFVNVGMAETGVRHLITRQVRASTIKIRGLWAER